MKIVRQKNNHILHFSSKDVLVSINICKFASNINFKSMERLNRIKGVLADAGKTNLWLQNKMVGILLLFPNGVQIQVNLIYKPLQK